MKQPVASEPQHRWTVLRLALGMLQMGGAVVSLVLLVMTGVSPVTVTAVVVTSALTTTSVLLFGEKKGGWRQ
jgi:hypothetical protein